MKKMSAIFVLFLSCSLFLLSEENAKRETETQVIEKDYGTFNIPMTFVKSDKFSSKYKDFYVKIGDENETFPNNISVNTGTNRYSLEEHMRFKDAILRQLLMQLGNSQAQLGGSGSFTEQGYVLYKFVITDQECITTQYYIVADYKYVLVHVTVLGESKETDEAAEMIVNSFRWKE